MMKNTLGSLVPAKSSPWLPHKIGYPIQPSGHSKSQPLRCGVNMDAAVYFGCSRLLSEQTAFPAKQIQDVQPKNGRAAKKLPIPLRKQQRDPCSDCSPFFIFCILMDSFFSLFFVRTVSSPASATAETHRQTTRGEQRKILKTGQDSQLCTGQL